MDLSVDCILYFEEEESLDIEDIVIVGCEVAPPRIENVSLASND